MTFSSVKINIGTNPNDGTGDNLRDAFFKVNYNFGQIEESLDEISKAVGPEGKSGENGTSGTSGVNGQNGTSGVDGERGPEGKQGTVGPIGPAGLNWKGMWREGDEYEVDDCVSFNGASWFCIRKISKIESNEKTPREHDNWQLLAAQGAEGKNGLNGTSGESGTSGISGVNGLNGTSGITPVGPQNYVQVLGSKVTGVDTLGVTLVSGDITTKGGPVSITVTGDANPIMISGTAWIRLQIYRGSTPVGNVVHVESFSSNINVPYCVTFIDNQPAGTYTYSMKSVLDRAGSFDFGEVNGPTLAMVELTGSGIDGTSGTSGVDGGKSIKKTKLLNHVIAVTPISGTTGEAVTSWSASYTSSGGSVEVIAQISGRRENAESIVNYYLQRDGVTVDTGTFCLNQVGVHTVLPTLCYITSAETGKHNYSIKLGTGLIVDQNDYCLMVVTEY